MKNISFYLAIAALFFATANAEAGALKDGYIMCTSKKGLDDAAQLAIQNKTSMLRSVGCYPTSSRFDGAILDRGFITTKVMLQMLTGETVQVWVPSEALAK